MGFQTHMNWLVVSTLPHYLSVLPLLLSYPDTAPYIYIVWMSTTLSVLWHLHGEPLNYLYYLDYLGATVWTGYELYASTGNLSMTAEVAVLNLIVFLLNMNPGSDHYHVYHSLWHLMSAAKCFYVAAKVTDATQ
uniref:Uncharacterized protein n=1 Tax=viral metagenome TaxID=1070528 RepID=A0A6C0DHR8_9ZZZZ